MIGMLAAPCQQQAKGHHSYAEDQMKPIICIVERDEVGCAVKVDDQPVNPEQQIDDSADHEVAFCRRDAARHDESGNAEQRCTALCR